jgi:hypothetical protein
MRIVLCKRMLSLEDKSVRRVSHPVFSCLYIVSLMNSSGSTSQLLIGHLENLLQTA